MSEVSFSKINNIQIVDFHNLVIQVTDVEPVYRNIYITGKSSNDITIVWKLTIDDLNHCCGLIEGLLNCK
jgi:hypothetical protein